MCSYDAGSQGTEKNVWRCCVLMRQTPQILRKLFGYACLYSRQSVLTYVGTCLGKYLHVFEILRVKRFLLSFAQFYFVFLETQDSGST